VASEIETSGRLVLGCGRCGERLVLLGREEDWLCSDRRTFPCGGCGRRLSLGARVVEENDGGGRPGDEPWHRALGRRSSEE
jgi:hypothetical protein